MSETPEAQPEEQPETQPVETPSPTPFLSEEHITAVPDGSVVVNSDGEHEQIVHDTDENGKVIGWHKEAVNG